MEYCNDFKYDLKVGQEAENELGKILSCKTIEVKRDSWTYKSGNIAVEFESRGKKSGIATSKAEWWAFVLSGGYKDEIIVLIKDRKIRSLTTEYYIKGSVKEMGDNNTSKAVLIPIKEIFKNTQ